MLNDNKHNLLYFENTSMSKLYENMRDWQNKNHKRLLSMSIQKDEGKFCCIALSNPSEVVIVAKNHIDRTYEEIQRNGYCLLISD